MLNYLRRIDGELPENPHILIYIDEDGDVMLAAQWGDDDGSRIDLGWCDKDGVLNFFLIGVSDREKLAPYLKFNEINKLAVN